MQLVKMSSQLIPYSPRVTGKSFPRPPRSDSRTSSVERYKYAPIPWSFSDASRLILRKPIALFNVTSKLSYQAYPVYQSYLGDVLSSQCQSSLLPRVKETYHYT